MIEIVFFLEVQQLITLRRNIFSSENMHELTDDEDGR